VHERIRERLWASGVANDAIEACLDALESGEVSPMAVADSILTETSARSITSH
jgi:hypothetical protein